MAMPTENPSPIHNRLLAALPAEEMERLLPHLEEVEMRLGEVLYQPDTPIRYVYFPNHGTISVVAILENGSEVEIGVIGNEGMFGLPIVLGTDSAPLQAIVQIPDGAMRMKANLFREEVGHCGQLQRVLLRYAQAFFIQTAQTAACNRLHYIDGRLARWLLMCQDRSQSDSLQLTHEFIAIMLGVRRAGVSVAASKLQAQGLIKYSRGQVRILDRAGLEAATCECYQVVRKEFDRLLAA